MSGFGAETTEGSAEQDRPVFAGTDASSHLVALGRRPSVGDRSSHSTADSCKLTDGSADDGESEEQ